MLDPPTLSYCFKGAVDIIVSGSLETPTVLMQAALEVAVQAIEYPMEALTLLNDRHLTSACIKLLQDKSEHCSVLDDDFCVLCLKIIATCVQIATMIAPKTLSEFLEATPSVRDSNFTIAKFATATLADRMRSYLAGGPRPYLNPVITATESITLIKLLSGARDRFLSSRCAHPKLWAGWSYILFPTWCHLITDRFSDQPTIAPMVGDLLCRFSAGEFIYDDEQLIMEFLAELCYDKHKQITGSTDCSGYRLKQANEQDSELAITAAASKLSAGFLPLRLSYYFFLWAADCSNDLRPDLMISLLKAAMSRLWRTLDPAEDNRPLAFQRLRGVVQLPKAILVYVTSVVSVHIRLSTTVQTSYSPLIDAALNHNIFALLFRTLIFPLPCSYNSLSPSEQNSLNKMLSDLLEFVEEFGGFLSTIGPFSVKASQESHADWLKAAQHLDEHCHMYRDASQFARTHLSRCRAVWMEVGFFLFPNQLDGRSVPCSYPRCPYPTPLGGASLACENCQVATYCSYRCQNSHWFCTPLGDSHESICS